MSILAFVLAFATVAPPAAPPDQAARKHFERAEKLYALGKFQDALGEYEAAFDARPLPGFLFNIGQCYRNLGNLRQAVFSYKKYLSFKPEARNRDAVEELIGDLEKKIAEEDRRGPRTKPAVRLDPPPSSDPVPPRTIVIMKPDDPGPTADHPVYTRWWFWTIVGAAAVGAGAGIYAATASGGTPGPPDTSLHNVDFR